VKDSAMAEKPGRLIALAFGVGMLVWSLGLFGPAAILPYLQSERGWSVAAISAAITAHFLVSALVVAAMPEIHRTIGLRGTVIAGAIAVYAGFIAWATVPAPYFLFLAALLSGCGLACGGSATVNAIISAGFASGRAKALGIALNGAALGGVVLLPLLTFGGRTFGWASTLAILGLAAVVILLWGSAPLDGTGKKNDLAPRAGPADTPMSRRALIRSPRFLSLAFAFSIAIFVQVGIYSQLINHLRPMLGIDGATFAMTGCIVFAIAGRSAVAWNIGQANRRVVAAASFLMQAAGVFALAFAPGPVGAVLGCVLFALGLGNLPLLPPLIVQQEFDEQSFILVVSTVSAVNQIILAFGPMTFGLLYAASGAYTLPFAIGSLLYVVAAVAVMLHARVEPRPGNAAE
jgi:predicted MFS family arabinose efflux permease